MKVITSFTHLKTGEGDRIAYTYSDIADDGTLVSQNNKGNFIVISEEMLGHIDAIKKYIQKTFLEEK